MNQPRGIFSTEVLSNTAVPVFSDGRFVSGWRIKGGAAAEIVIFRKTDDTELFRVSVGVGESVISPCGFYADGGLELICASVAGDVNVNVFYTQG